MSPTSIPCKCIRKGTIKPTSFQPIAFIIQNKGVQLILDAVLDYLPDPTDVNPQPEVDADGNETGEHAVVDANRPLRALAFKIMDDKYGALIS